MTPTSLMALGVKAMSLIKVDPVKVAQVQTAKAQAERARAYKQEADPLFFKYQRGEATEQEWLTKVDEIRARYPYPEE